MIRARALKISRRTTSMIRSEAMAILGKRAAALHFLPLFCCDRESSVQVLSSHGGRGRRKKHQILP